MDVVFVGPVGAGKTCLVQRIAYGESLNSLSTTAACCYRCEEQLPNTRLYDTPGDERFSWMYDGIMQRADVIVYCVDPNDTHSRNYREFNKGAQILLVHTKADTTTERHPNNEDEFDTSSLTGEGIEALKSRLSSERKKRTFVLGSSNEAELNRIKPRKTKPKCMFS